MLFCPKVKVTLTRIEPFPIYTSSPNANSSLEQLSTDSYSIIRSWIALARYPDVRSHLMTLCSICTRSYDFNQIVRMCTQVIEYRMGQAILAVSQVVAKNPELSSMLSEKIPKKTDHIGRLGFKVEAAGKLRVFAMVDPFTQ